MYIHISIYIYVYTHIRMYTHNYMYYTYVNLREEVADVLESEVRLHGADHGVELAGADAPAVVRVHRPEEVVEHPLGEDALLEELFALM